jgi:uncharacterized lipoprotein YbaY
MTGARRHWRAWLAGLLACGVVVLLAACDRPPREVTGTATWPARGALPADAVLEIALEDLSRAGGASVAVARVSRLGQPPVEFSLPIEAGAIDASHEYVVRARVTAGDRVLLATAEASPVLTRGRPATVAISLAAPAATAASATPPLRGLFVYLADAPVFEPCGAKGRVPVAMEGDYLALERAYTTAGGLPGLPQLVTVEGRVEERPAAEGTGSQPTLVIARFISIAPTESCGDLPPIPPPR